MKKFFLFLLIICFIVGAVFMVRSCVKEVDENGRVIDDQKTSVPSGPEEDKAKEVVVEVAPPEAKIAKTEITEKKLLRKKKIFRVLYDKSKGIPGWYRVQEGDDPRKLSRKFYGTEMYAHKICEDNGIPFCGLPLESGKLIMLYPREG